MAIGTFDNIELGPIKLKGKEYIIWQMMELFMKESVCPALPWAKEALFTHLPTLETKSFTNIHDALVEALIQKLRSMRNPPDLRRADIKLAEIKEMLRQQQK